MPDLHTDAIHAFWDSYDRRTLYRIIVALERVEDWTLDEDPEVKEVLLALGNAIDTSSDIDVEGSEDKIIRILATIKAGKALRVLQSLDMAKPGTASKVLMYAEEKSESKDDKPSDPYAKMFLRRNLVFERLQLLSRVFSPQRISLVIKALSSSNE